MSNNLKLALAGAVFLVLLILVIATYKSPYQASVNDKLPKLPTLTKDEIDKVEITRMGTTISFEKRGLDWWIAKPIEAKADTFFATGIAEKLAAEKWDLVINGVRPESSTRDGR